jgi:hypothetical protein
MEDKRDELVRKYCRHGHPSAEELVAAQGLTFPRDPRDLLGNFWPEEDSIDDFLAAMREWRRSLSGCAMSAVTLTIMGGTQ